MLVLHNSNENWTTRSYLIIAQAIVGIVCDVLAFAHRLEVQMHTS